MGEELIYGHTKQGLRVIRQVLQQEQARVLLVVLRSSNNFPVKEQDGLTQFEVRQQLLVENRARLLNELRRIKQQHPTLMILTTEVKEAADVFGLIPDDFDEEVLQSIETMRLIDYSKVADSKTSFTYSIEEM